MSGVIVTRERVLGPASLAFVLKKELLQGGSHPPGFRSKTLSSLTRIVEILGYFLPQRSDLSLAFPLVGWLSLTSELNVVLLVLRLKGLSWSNILAK